MISAGPFDEGYIAILRHEIRQCLRCDPPQCQSNTVAAMRSTKNAPRCFSPKKRAGGAVTVHAIQNRSIRRPADLGAGLPHQSSDTLSIWRLASGHICSILAHYAENSTHRRKECQRLAAMTARQFRTEKTRHRAKLIALVILAGGSTKTVRERLLIPADEWRGSGARRTYYAVAEHLRRVDHAALTAWDAKRRQLRRSA